MVPIAFYPSVYLTEHPNIERHPLECLSLVLRTLNSVLSHYLVNKSTICTSTYHFRLLVVLSAPVVAWICHSVEMITLLGRPMGLSSLYRRFDLSRESRTLEKQRTANRYRVRVDRPCGNDN